MSWVIPRVELKTVSVTSMKGGYQNRPTRRKKVRVAQGRAKCALTRLDALQSDALENDEFDIAIVGGGLVGAAIAWGAAPGRRIVVLDEGDVALRAARGNFALVWVQGKGLGMPQYGMWTLRAAEAWTAFAETLAAQTGIDVRYRRPGGFHLALSADELDQRVAHLRAIEAQAGMPSTGHEVLDAAGLRRKLADVGPSVVGGTFTRLDGHCDSLRLLRALHRGFRSAGGRYLAGRRVDSITKDRGEFRLRTQAGEIRAASVVLAAGLDNARLGPMVGLDIPVRAVRGQLLVTERTARFLEYPVSTVRQTQEGTVMIGDSHEEAAHSTATTPDVIAAMADRALKMFPRLARVSVVRTWAAQRVMPPDGCAIYDASRTHPGAFAAATHSGVTLAPNHALLLGPAIARGELPGEVSVAFGSRRFAATAAA
jgi:hydrogen cyanide synthase HcnC